MCRDPNRPGEFGTVKSCECPSRHLAVFNIYQRFYTCIRINTKALTSSARCRGFYYSATTLFAMFPRARGASHGNESGKALSAALRHAAACLPCHRSRSSTHATVQGVTSSYGHTSNSEARRRFHTTPGPPANSPQWVSGRCEPVACRRGAWPSRLAVKGSRRLARSAAKRP